MLVVCCDKCEVWLRLRMSNQHLALLNVEPLKSIVALKQDLVSHHSETLSGLHGLTAEDHDAHCSLRSCQIIN